MKRILVRSNVELRIESVVLNDTIGGLSLHVTYTPNYPDELPEYEIETIEGQIPSSYYTKIRESVKNAVRETDKTLIVKHTLIYLLGRGINWYGHDFYHGKHYKRRT